MGHSRFRDSQSTFDTKGERLLPIVDGHLCLRHQRSSTVDIAEHADMTTILPNFHDRYR